MSCAHAHACVWYVRMDAHIHTYALFFFNFEPGDELLRNFKHEGVGTNPNAVCITNFTCM